MKLPDKTHYIIAEAAEKLQCTTFDLIHFGANGRIKLAAYLRLESKKVETVPWDGVTSVMFGNDGLFYLDTKDLAILEFDRALQHVVIKYFYPTKLFYPTNPCYLHEFINDDGDVAPYTMLDKSTHLIHRDNLVVLHTDMQQFIQRELHTNGKDEVSVKSNNTRNEPRLENPQVKGGAPKGHLAEAVEYTYLKFKEEGNTEILRPGKIREFMKRLKELANETGNPNFSEYIADRIDSVKISLSGCTVKTKDQFIKASTRRENTIKARTYKQDEVSKLLTNLRMKYPLPT